MSFVEGSAREQINLLPPCIDDYVAGDALVRVVDAFVASLNLAELGFGRTAAAATGRPGYHPADMLRLYIWGYLNQVRSSRLLERACVRDLEAIWLMRKLTPDYRTIAAFRHDNSEAIVGASAAFIQFCRQAGLISGRLVALDGTKMRAVANEANDGQLLHPMSMAAMEVLQVEELRVLADGGYSNAQAVAQCERDKIEVAAPIKRGAMSTGFFRPTQFTYEEASDTIRCPAGEILRPSGKHTRNRAIR